MKRLLLLRHAKAVAKSSDDLGRVLAPRGKSDMAAIARILAEPGMAPDLAFVSPSARTRETWALANLPDVPAQFEPAIYDADERTLRSLVRETPDDIGAVILVGHNPGISELALNLAADTVAKASGLDGGLPTAALVVLRFETDKWHGVTPGSGRIERMATPASLAASGA